MGVHARPAALPAAGRVDTRSSRGTGGSSGVRLAAVTPGHRCILDSRGLSRTGLVHRATPGSGLCASALDELLELLEILLGLLVDDVQEVTGLLHQPLGLVFQAQ